MANVISGTDYLVLANEYASVRDAIVDQKDSMFDAVYYVVFLQSLYPEVDLLSPTWEAYQINASSSAIPQGILTAVRAIQQHVLNRGGYTTVDAYLAAEAITVPSGWAILSEAAGFTISAIYIT